MEGKCGPVWFQHDLTHRTPFTQNKGVNLDYMGEGPLKSSINMHWVADLSESLIGTRAAAWEDRDTGVF